jgi:D-alanyl-D-alanine carboxypeptidase (penicillin-binding protein 5/6)
MRKLLIPLLILISFAAHATPTPPTIAAKSAIVVDSMTGKVLYTKDCHTKRPPASTTKIMTAILALEHGNLDDEVCASAYACQTPNSSLHLKPGEVLTLHNLLYGLLLRSGNDAAVCTAEHIAGTEAKFVQMMNERAKELGAKDTHFVNPHGLYKPTHYSTAYDLALIAQEAIRYPLFNEIVRTRKTRIERSMNAKDAYLTNHARFLWRFEGADGIKTGYTREAGRCFVGSATREGWRPIAVILKANDAGADAAAILNFIFKYYQGFYFAKPGEVVTRVPVAEGVQEKAALVPSSSLGIVVRKSSKNEGRTEIETQKARAPIEKGQKLGTLTGYLNGKRVGSVDLIAAESVDRTLGATVWVWTRSVLLVCILSLTAYFGYGTAAAKASRRRRRSLAPRS